MVKDNYLMEVVMGIWDKVLKFVIGNDNEKREEVQKEDKQSNNAKRILDSDVELGLKYYNGNGVERDYKKAVYFFKLAADRKNKDGLYWLAECYMDGKGVSENHYRAVQYYYEAALLGEGYSQAKLGICYFLGDGIDKKPSEAFKWLRESIMYNGNYFMAGYHLALCYINGIGTEIDEKKGFRALSTAVEVGCAYHKEAQKLLAECYEKGIGTPKDVRTAQDIKNSIKRYDSMIAELCDMYKGEIRRKENK